MPDALPPPDGGPNGERPAPVVSVVTACYNSEAFVAETVASVRAQTFSAWEHVVVDDGSTDNSRAVIASLLPADARLRLIAKRNGGVATARNAGVAASHPNSRYLLFLDADDLLVPEMLAVLVAHLDAHPEAGLAYCAMQFVDAADQPIPTPPARRYRRAGRWARAISPDVVATPLEALFAAALVLPSATLVRRTVYAETGGWDEAFGQPCEDTDLFVRVALRADAHFVNRPLVRYRQHGAQSTANADRLERQWNRLEQKWARADDPALPEAARTRARAAVAFRQNALAYTLGFHEAARHLREGHLALAARFGAGAARRFVRAAWRPAP